MCLEAVCELGGDLYTEGKFEEAESLLRQPPSLKRISVLNSDIAGIATGGCHRMSCLTISQSFSQQRDGDSKDLKVVNYFADTTGICFHCHRELCWCHEW